MPRISGISLRAGPCVANVDVVIDGTAYPDLILHSRNNTVVSWPAGCTLPLSQRKRYEPQIRRAYAQWLDLAGADA